SRWSSGWRARWTARCSRKAATRPRTMCAGRLAPVRTPSWSARRSPIRWRSRGASRPPRRRRRSGMPRDRADALLPSGLGAGPEGRRLREILEGLVAKLAPGDALPSERLLAERYGVARMTVRGELDRLTAEGLTYRVQGRGTFVAEPRVAQASALSSFSEDM